MTTATAKRKHGKRRKSQPLLLRPAEAQDIRAILKETYELWNAGMPRDAYYEWNWSQLSHPWARRNFRYFVLRQVSTVLASCKVYTLEFNYRGRDVKVAGIGAVFTMPAHRGRGHGCELMQQVVQLCEDEGYDAVLLFSDIDTGFYEQFGFEPLSDLQFYIWMNDPEVERQIMFDESFVEDLHDHEADVSLLDLSQVEDMVAHYQRYLPSVPFNMRRSDLYWHFKLSREQHVQQHASIPRPPLEMLSLDLGSSRGGYAIFEQAGKILRVLEVIGGADTREALWRNLLRTALLRRVQLVRGWEAAAPSFVRSMRFAERDVARPMLLPLSEAAESWLDARPCPLLELDHF